MAKNVSHSNFEKSPTILISQINVTVSETQERPMENLRQSEYEGFSLLGTPVTCGCFYRMTKFC